MNDIRRTMLWVVFGLSLVMLWDQWQVYNGRETTFLPSPTPVVAQAGGAAPASSVPNAVPSATPSVAINTDNAAAAGVIAPQAEASSKHEQVVAQNDLLKVTFDTEGGSVVRTEFLKEVDKFDKSRNFVLLDDSKERFYEAQSGLIASAGGAALPTHKTLMTLAPGDRALKDGSQTIELRFESAEVGGVKLIKTYTLTRGSYAMDVKFEVVNVGTTPVAPQLYMQLVRDGNKPPGESKFYSTFTGPAVYTEAKKYQKVTFENIEKNKVDVEKSATNGYVAMVQHYFASAWLLGDGITRELFLRKVDTNLYSVGMITPLQEIAPGGPTPPP